MEQYELAVLYHPDLEIDLEKAEKQVEKLVTDAGGSIKATDNWGKRKLAYKIATHEHAVYVFYTLEMPAAGVAPLNNGLNIVSEVIRFLITKPDLKAIAKAEAMKVNRDKRLSKMADDAESDDEEADEE
ncbi:MAG TPA: 30S ribosomal protein S6 [Candidatus Saccharibacteria bacterium]|nr:30S ribosomal protein S6 [Candidatus Saccharibacteria bacterium]HMT55294.1 30S ribosomal protein S6 [Candidatus Saccharibacteria bacterium]